MHTEGQLRVVRLSSPPTGAVAGLVGAGRARVRQQPSAYRPFMSTTILPRYNRYAAETVSSRPDHDRPDPLQRRQSRGGALAEALQVNRQALCLQHTDACTQIFGHGSDRKFEKDKGVSRHSPANFHESRATHP